MPAKPKAIKIKLNLPKEAVETIQDMGYDPISYFNAVVNDLYKRYQTKVEKEIITGKKADIDAKLVKVKGKTKVEKDNS